MTDNMYQVMVPFSGFSVRKTGKTENRQGAEDRGGVTVGSSALTLAWTSCC